MPKPTFGFWPKSDLCGKPTFGFHLKIILCTKPYLVLYSIIFYILNRIWFWGKKRILSKNHIWFYLQSFFMHNIIFGFAQKSFCPKPFMAFNIRGVVCFLSLQCAIIFLRCHVSRVNIDSGRTSQSPLTGD